MNKHASRKYMAAWGLTLLVTALLVFPPLLGKLVPIFAGVIFVSASEWTSFIMWVWSFYFGANVATKGMLVYSNSKAGYVTDSDSLDKAG